MNSAQAGGGAIGDIGTPAYNLTGFVTGLHTQALSAALQGYVPGQSVDNDARVTLQYDGRARGHIWASQVAIRNENNLTLAIYGSKASIRWAQENLSILWFTTLSEAPRMITRGGGGAYPAANAVTRIPSGHPEGYLEAFATLCREAAEAILSKRAATGNNALIGIAQCLDGVRFVDAANGHQTPMRLGSHFHNSLNTRIWIVCGMRLHLGRIAR